MSGTTATAVRRLVKEYKLMQKVPIPNVIAKPSSKNTLLWYFMLYGLDAPYDGGIYIGKIVFPREYPFKPPDVIFLTPNGRFQTKKKICLSFTSYHPESWNPQWSMQNMLLGIISFWHEGKATTGSLRASAGKRRQLARESFAYNLTLPN
jgi:ubiquitin-conjugating enzyme E2 J2